MLVSRLKNKLHRSFKIQLLTLVVSLCCNLASIAAQCFTSQRFPKVIQSATGATANHAEAVAVSTSLSAVFVGGQLNQSSFRPTNHPSEVNWAHIGRIGTDTKMWVWSKVFKDSALGMETITALAVEGSSLAVVGTNSSTGNPLTQNYIFILDAATGSSTSTLQRIDHGAGAEYQVRNAGLLFTGGVLYFAFNHMGSVRPNSYEQKMFYASWDPSTTTMGATKMASGNYYGRSSSLIKGESDVYIGGSYDNNQAGKWSLAFIRLDSGSNTITENLIHYNYEGSCNDIGYTTTADAPYISHLGYYSSFFGKYLFGLTESNNHAGSREGAHTLVFRIKLDSNGDADSDSGNLKIKLLSTSDYLVDSKVIGMYHTMDFDNWKLVIHILFQRSTNEVYYLKLQPDSDGDNQAQRVSSESITPYAAVFYGTSKTVTLGSANSFEGIQAYIVGAQQSYTASQSTNYVDFGANSYIVLPLMDDDDNCHRASFQDITINLSDPSCNKSVEIISDSWTDWTSTITSSLNLLEYEHASWEQASEAECNSGDTPIVQVTGGDNSSLLTSYCYAYSTGENFTLAQSTVTDPTTCTDAVIYNQVALAASSIDSPAPPELAIGFDSATDQISWSYVDGSAPGFTSAMTEGVFTFDVTSFVLYSSFVGQEVFTFEIDINACNQPTVINSPTASQTSYSYMVGDSLAIQLSGGFTSDNIYCTLPTPAVSISPTPPVGMFTSSVDFQTMTVSSSDLSLVGSTYTVTIQPATTSCVTVTPVTYDVVVDNPCETASFSIDPDNSVFVASGANTAVHAALSGVTTTIAWDVASDIISSITWTDPCGAITQEIWDVTGGTEVALDSSIFSATLTGANQQLNLNIMTNPVTLLYNLRLKAYYTAYVASESSIDFDIEITPPDPCEIATLSFDSSTDSSITQYVGYPGIIYSWDDSIVTSTDTSGSCGAYIHYFVDYSSGSEIAIDSAVFNSLDLVSASKSVTIATSDFAKVGTYSVRVKAQYASYPSGFEAIKSFDVIVVDYCVPTSITTDTPSDISYTLGRTAETSSFVAWTAVPNPCNFVYTMTISPAVTDPGLIVFDDSIMTINVFGQDVFYGGDHLTGTYTPGSYTVEIRAWADNSVDTGFAVTCSVVVQDPCDPAQSGSNITIQTTVVSPNPLAYSILDPALAIVLDTAAIVESETIVSCTDYELDVINTDLTTSLDSIFTWNQATLTLTIQSDDLTKAPTFQLRLTATYLGGSQKTYQESGFLVIVINVTNPCNNPVSLSAPSQTNVADYYYTGSSPSAVFTATPFVVDPVECSVTYNCAANTGMRSDLCNLNEDSGATLTVFDTAKGDLTITTTNMVAVTEGTYVFTLEGTVGSATTQGYFSITFVDPCPSLAVLTISTDIFSAPLTYNLRDAAVQIVWDPLTVASTSGVLVDGNCGAYDVAFFLNDGSETPLDSSIFTDSRGPPIEFIVNQISDTLLAGSYDVSYNVFLADYTAVKVAATTSMVVTVVDPCMDPVASVLAVALTNQNYYVTQPAVTYQIAAFTPNESWCTLTYSYSTDSATLDASGAIQFDTATQTFTFQYSLDNTIAGQTYTITVAALLDTATDSSTFNINIWNACPAALYSQVLVPTDTQLASQVFYIGVSSPQDYYVQGVASNAFQASIPICGDVSFTADLLHVEDQTSVTLSETTQLFNFFTDGKIEVFTEDFADLGDYELHISAHLEDYPIIVASDTYIMPFEIRRCAVTAQTWLTEDVTIAPNAELVYALDFPVYQISGAGACDYRVASYRYSIENQADSSELAVVDYVVFDQSTLTLTFIPQSNADELVATIQMTASLTDEYTEISTQFDVTFLPIVSDTLIEFTIVNDAPFMTTQVEKQYERVKVDNSTVIEPIKFGGAQDLQGDQVTSTLECQNCEFGLLISYDEVNSEVLISAGIATGMYKMSLTLTDDNEDPMSHTYEFNIIISQQEELVEEVTEVDVPVVVVKPFKWIAPKKEELVGKVQPSFKLVSLSLTGRLVVQFDQKMVIPSQIKEIDQSVFYMGVIPDETNEVDDQSMFDFTWKVVSYEKQKMTIQIEFKNPIYISAGLNRDYLQAVVKNPDYFFSQETFLSIPLDTTQKIKAPKMMADTEFTAIFESFNQSLGAATNITLAGNFVTNLLLSGAMNLLWGLLHALQIVAHFPLVNIMMPANAQMLFAIIVKVATFDIIPTETLIQEAESDVGLERDKIAINDSFIDFGFDSTDPVRNLQIMFIVLAFLCFFPILSLLIRGLCFWSSRAKRCVNRMNRIMYWNIYIRFGLETYLELSISSMLRFYNFNFEQVSDSFHSAMTAVLLLLTFLFMVVSTVLLQVKFHKLREPGYPDKFNELIVGLKLKKRSAILSPGIFMLRRFLYALMLITLSHRSYFQVQFLIFKCALTMIYSGQVQPFIGAAANKMDLLNETLTLFSSYSLITFSAFVPSPQIRFECGWFLIGFVLLTVLLNLCLIVVQSCKMSIHRCKLKMLRRKNLKIGQQRMQNYLKHQNRLRLAENAVKNDPFYKGAFPQNLKSEYNRSKYPIDYLSLESIRENNSLSEQSNMDLETRKHFQARSDERRFDNELSSLSDIVEEEKDGAIRRVSSLSNLDLPKSMSNWFNTGTGFPLSSSSPGKYNDGVSSTETSPSKVLAKQAQEWYLNAQTINTGGTENNESTVEAQFQQNKPQTFSRQFNWSKQNALSSMILERPQR